MSKPTVPMHVLSPGVQIENDWFPGRIPSNIEVGRNVMIESSHTFHGYRSQATVGLIVGDNVTLWRTALATERDGVIEIGNDCYLSTATLVCARRITLGRRVMVAPGATITDSDFHPIGPADRVADTIALSAVGNRAIRPEPQAQPVVIEDDVWIGFNATILKAVRLGAGAVIMPGAVVTGDVPAGATAEGNPAKVSAS